MTADFDCMVGTLACTNHPGTVDDSWSGTLGEGEHTIVVYSADGGSGSYTLSVSARTPSNGGSEGTQTKVTTLVETRATNVSAGQAHGFTLERPAEVDVALTGLTTDFNCIVGSSFCTNHSGTQDDSWNGELAAGSYEVVVYPPESGSGDYSLTVTATETLGVVSLPFAGVGILIAAILSKEDDDGNVMDGSCNAEHLDVIGEDPGEGQEDQGEDTGPPGGTGPGQGDPAPEDSGGGGGGGGGTTQPPSLTEEEKDEQVNAAVSDALNRLKTCRVHNRSRGLVTP